MGEKKAILLICFYDKISLSLKALSAKLKQAGHNVHIVYFKDDHAAVINKFKENSTQYQMLWLDQFWGCGQDVNPITDKEWGMMKDLARKINPDIIGISSRTIHKDLALETAKELRPLIPEAVFLAGGYGPILLARDYLEQFDYICVGEGDDVIVPFVEAADPKKVSNIAYLENGKVVWNEILPPTDLDKLPYPDWESDNKYLIENDEIKTGHSFIDSKTYIVFCSRGCPSTCTYCMACQWSEMMKPYGSNFPKIRLRSPESVINELLQAKEKLGIKYVVIKDDIFGLSEKWLFDFMEMYDREIGLEFSCLLDERFTNEKKVKRLYESGLRKTVVGIQSANEDLRRRVFGRQISDDEIVAYAEMLASFGIGIRYDIIGWNPFENSQSLSKGMEFLKRLPKCLDTSAFELKIFPGSRLEEIYLREKPMPISNEEYTFWALLHQMTLYSKETEEQAFAFADSGKREVEPVLLYFRNKIKDNSEKLKVVALNDIEKGCRIINDRVGLQETEEPGITSSEMDKLMDGMFASKPIKKGTVIKWEDLINSYEGIRGRGKNI